MTPSLSSHIANLTAQWRQLGLMFVAFAWQITRQERAGARDIWKSLETLELCIRVSLIDLNREIAQLRDPSRSGAASEDALDYLCAIAAALLALAIYLQIVKARMKQAGWVQRQSGRHAGTMSPLTGRVCRMPPPWHRSAPFRGENYFNTS